MEAKPLSLFHSNALKHVKIFSPKGLPVYFCQELLRILNIHVPISLKMQSTCVDMQDVSGHYQITIKHVIKSYLS